MKNVLVLLILFPIFSAAQHSISGTFSPENTFTTVYLYQINPESPQYLNYITHTDVDANGKVNIALSEELTPGMYQLNFGIPRADYHFNFIYNTKEDIVFNYDVDDGVTYIQSEENSVYQEYFDKSELTSRLLSAVFHPEVTKKDFDAVFEAIQEVQHHFEVRSQGLMAHHFIKTGRSPIPKKQINPSEYVALEKEHYFDNINFDDTVLKNSFRLLNLSILYVLKFDKDQNSDTYIENIDEIMRRIGTDSNLKKEVLTRLWVNFSMDENTEVANYIAETYLIPVAKKKGDHVLISEINQFKVTALGSKAPDFKLGDGRTLSNLSGSERYLLIFWSSTCSHCLKELPQIRDSLKNIDPQKLQVIAFGLEEQEFPWKAITGDYPNFIHIYGEGKWDNETANIYNINSTPTYFILNKNKTISAKPESLEDLLNIINP